MYNDDQPGVLPAVPRMVCIGDVHGDLGRLVDILKVLRIIDSNMQWIAEPSNTIVVQLGDQVDSSSRGATEDWETVNDVDVVKFMDMVDRVARRSGGRVLSILGNHEIMNVMGDYTYVSPRSMELSGGVNQRAHLFRSGGHIAHILAKRNVVLKIGNVTFCHGGLLPVQLDMIGDNTAIINNIARRFLRGEVLNDYEVTVFNNNILGPNAILWTRTYFDLLSSQQHDELNQIVKEVCNRLGTSCIVVGHNTVNHITPAVGGALWLVDAGLSRSYDSTYNEVLEILHDDDLNRQTEFRVIRMDKSAQEGR